MDVWYIKNKLVRHVSQKDRNIKDATIEEIQLELIA